MYKYMLVLPNGARLYKADPYANYAEMRPGTASKVYDLNHFKWTDKKWMTDREKKDMNKEPMELDSENRLVFHTVKLVHNTLLPDIPKNRQTEIR